ncbi:TonB-dependent receptor plug domain-containing protein [Chitinimonas sp.]|uniref:TonB-dependent receptor plug domain-containing protein n=1 Tax=Chitinimonas sp. TaxID=1934313 RepID=UPI0035B203E8
MPSHTFPFRLTLFTLACSAALHALADDKPASDDTKVKPAAQSTEKIDVTGKRATDLDIRRNSTASKLIFTREELDQYGDSSVGEILKRLPGVTIGGKPGRGGEIRMRGLGSGYTQILINGEPVPRGFSFDSLAPEQIERIEVIRAPVAEHSAQAIAGTINILLREGLPKGQTELRLELGSEQGRLAPEASFTKALLLDKMQLSLSGSVQQSRQANDSSSDTEGFDANGAPTLLRHQNYVGQSRSNRLFLTPRINYRFDEEDSLTFQPFIMRMNSRSSSSGTLQQPLGDAPPYASFTSNGDSDSAVARGFGNWTHKQADGSKLEVKFGFGANSSNSHTLRQEYGSAGQLQSTQIDDSHVHDRSANIGGKYSQPLGDGHTLGVGWEGEWGTRSQERLSLDNGVPQLTDLGDSLNANTRRLAVYGQDEWDITPRWAAYFGLRWEGVRTRSETTNGWSSNTSSVLSPTLHTVWRLPDTERDQIRANITRSYRAPTLANLLAIPSRSHLNSPTSPDSVGNPDLKPELAWGFELGYEHYLKRNGLISANLFSRQIDNLIRRQTSLQVDRWTASPVNIAKAQAYGMELEAKFQLAELFDNAPAIEVRSNYSRFWSSVDGIKGPNNRLDQQPRQTANIGVDYRLSSLPLTLGGNLNWTPAYEVQTSNEQYSSTGNKKVLDIYGLWKFNPKLQLRIAASNLLHQDYDGASGYDGLGANQQAQSSSKTYTTWTAKLEMKF